MTLSDRAVPLLSGARIDETTKGFTALDQPVSILEVEQRGWTIDDLAPPFCVVRRSALDHNLRLMSAYCARRGVRLAPHGKVSMAPQLWWRQLAEGAWGMSAAGAGQARVMRAAGIRRVVIANELVDGPSIRWAAVDLEDEEHELVCQVDSTAGVAALEDGLREAGVGRRLPVLVELGHPSGRTGCRELQSAMEVAANVERTDLLRLAGVTAYEGTLADDRRPASLANVRAFLDELHGVGETLFERFPIDGEPIVSAGGSMFFDVAAEVLSDGWAGAVEVLIRPGCYLTHDTGHYAASSPFGAAPPEARFRSAIEVWGVVLSRPEPDLAIVGLGRRDVPFDQGYPRPLLVRRGLEEMLSIDGFVEVTGLNDQHAYCRVSGDVSLEVGDLVMFGISHPCSAFDRWRVIAELDDDDRVVGAIATFF
jgi:D-serine deaminase-like pyridoxal phosphate-dependent protein